MLIGVEMILIQILQALILMGSYWSNGCNMRICDY